MTIRSSLFGTQLVGASLLSVLAACGESDADTSVDYGPGITGDSGPSDGGAFDAYVPAWDGQVQWPSDASIDAAPGDASLVDGSAGDGSAPDGAAGLGIGLDGTGYTVFPTTGMPLDAANNKWTYFEFADTSCRDGTKAGITVFRNTGSKKVFFFFEGGGACFDSVTCGANPKAVDANDKAGPTGGILDRSNAANPVKDWNIVYVPYCTGDVFAGTKADGNVEGVGPQKFVGYLNSQAFLQRLGPTFKDSTDILVTGVSAGGFGASSNVVLIQRAFPDVKVKLIDDSGPPMGSKVLATCLQKKWRETWGLDKSMLLDCGASCTKQDDYTLDYGVHLAKTFQNRLSGLIESAQDGIISGFFGAGRGGLLGGGPCTGTALVTAVPGPEFQAGLLEFRDALKPYPSFGAFIPAGTQHTWLMGASFYTHATGGTKMVDWFSDIVNDKGTKNVGP